MKSRCAFQWGFFLAFLLSVAPGFAQNQPPSDLTVVSINTPFRNKTAEPCPVCFVAPGIFTISRTGTANTALTVYLQADGTAQPGIDYKELPRQVIIPAGTEAVDVLVLPFDDLLPEGPEIVRATLVTPEIATLGYRVNPEAAQALVVIGDDERGAPEIRLDIVHPLDGSQIAAGVPIEVSALGVWTQGELDQPVEFFAGDRLIGRSNPPQLDRPTIPGLPSLHSIIWSNAPAGRHVLTARYHGASEEPVVSPPVRVTVGAEPPRSVVRIEATQSIAEESSVPFRRLAFRGIFTVSRTGPTTSPLSIFVHYSGSAVPGTDYPGQPFLLTLPAGEASVEIEIVPENDGIAEGLETVFATLSHCPPETRPPLGIACRDGFVIDPAHGQATVWIRDDGVTQAGLTITSPEEGASFDSGETISIEAVAIDLEGYISRVEFYDGNRQIGVSKIFFIRAPDPGTPIYHSFEWMGAAPGAHELTARAVASDGSNVISPPVHLTVGMSDRLPVVTVTAPDPVAVEGDAATRLNTGAFRIRRAGPTNTALVVAYSLEGTAEEGVDYETVPSLTTIPAGHETVDLLITPRTDDLREGTETVRLRLVEPPPPSPEIRVINPYHVGRPSDAVVIISDTGIEPIDRARCVAVGDKMLHISFPAEAGKAFRLEASSDFLNWETLFTGVSSEGLIHYIDTDTGERPCRFYRLTPEP